MLYSIYRMTIFARSCMIISINLIEGMVVMEKETDNSLIGCMREVPDPRLPYNQKHKRTYWGIENSLLDIGFRVHDAPVSQDFYE